MIEVGRIRAKPATTPPTAEQPAGLRIAARDFASNAES